MRLNTWSVVMAVMVSLNTGWANALAKFHTPVGDMTVELFDDDKPITVQNFIRYVQSGAYQNMFFHRCVPNFVMQGGGFFVTNRTETGLATHFFNTPNFGNILNEFNVGQRFSNVYGTLAMAKLGGDPNSASSQWFFNLADNSANLDNQNGGFTVFGRVTSGTNVLQSFNGLQAGGGGIVNMTSFYGASASVFSDLPVNYQGYTPPYYPDLMYVDITVTNVTPRFTVTTSVTGQGSIVVNPVLSSYAQGSSITATAIPATNFMFINWGGDLSGSNNPASRVVSSNLNITATFKKAWTLTTTNNGNGTVIRQPDLAQYVDQTPVTLTAVPGPGYAFVNWTAPLYQSVSNPVVVIMSYDFNVTANFKDIALPTVTIITPVSGLTQDERYTLAGTVSDNVGVVSAHWQLNGQEMGALAITNGQFTATGLKLGRGDNFIRVLAKDAAGNEGSSAVLATWAPIRSLALVAPAPIQEGLRLTVPLELTSQGEISQANLTVSYDTNYLRDPQLIWSSLLGTAAKQVNYAVPGQVQLSCAFSTGTIPFGTNSVANLSLRARSVPSALNTGLGLNLNSLAGPTGEPLVFGTYLQPANARILPRQIKGDINGDNRLDVGDASLMQRLITGLEPERSWDITENDLDNNGALDAVDVSQVLKTIVGLIPPPQLPAGQSALTNQNPGSGSIILMPTNATGIVGGTTTLQVQVQGLDTSLCGATVYLDYPTNALRLLNSQSYQTGSLVPGTAAVVWNVPPNLVDYSAQTGRVAFASSTPVPWSSTNGVLAEFTFQIQAGASRQTAWPIRLTGQEITIDGYENRQFAESIVLFALAGSQAPVLTAVNRGPNGQGFGFTLQGTPGVTYQIQSSLDLRSWTPVITYVNFSGNTNYVESAFTDFAHRFYRAVIP